MPLTSNLRAVSRDRRPCFYVQVSGIPVLFGSVEPPSKAYDLNGVATEYEKRTCIVPNQGFKFSRKLNIKKNSVECSPVQVVLASTEQSSQTDMLDPARIFGRLGFPGADASLEFALGQEILQTTATPFEVTMSDDPTSYFSAGDIVHVGREAFRIDSLNAGTNKITINQRAVLGTRKASHIYDSTTQVPLVMTKPACFFRGRRAVIFEGTVGDDGVGRDYVERWRGFITNEPEVSTSGKVPTVTVHISPLTALLDLPMGTQDPAVHLTKRAHCFTGGVGVFWTFLERIPRGALVDASTNIEYPDSDGTTGLWEQTGFLPISEAGAHRWQRMQTGSKTKHPFGVPVQIDCDGTIGAQTYYSSAISWDKLPPSLESASDPYNHNAKHRRDVLALENTTGTEVRSLGNGRPLEGGRVISAASSHYREIRIATSGSSFEVVEWPGALRDKINATGSLGIESYGMGGTYPDGGAAAMVGLGGGFTALHLDAERERLVLTSSIDGPEKTVQAVFLHKNAPEDANSSATQRAKRWTFNADSELSITPHLIKQNKLSPVAFAVDEQTEDNEVAVDVPGRERGSALGLEVGVKLATAFYQTGEKYVLVDSPLRVPSTGRLYVEVDHPSKGRLGTMEATLSTSTTLADGSTAYRIDLATAVDASSPTGEPLKSFAEYRGEERIELKPAAVFTPEAPIGEVLLQLLCSSGGNQTTSLHYDKLPYGAGLLDGSTSGASSDELGLEVDVSSFLAIESPIPNSQFRPAWHSGQSIRDAVGGLLHAAGYVVDIVTNEAGKCLLTAIPIGFPNRSAVVGSFTQTDIADRPIAQSKTEFAQANVFAFKYAYDHNNQPTKTQRVKDAVSIDIAGEERSMSIPLPGVELSETIDRVSQLRPIFSRLRYELALPRRIYELHLRAGLALQSRIGGTYSLTHSLLRDVNALGVSGVLCRLRAIHQDGWKATARAELVYYGQSGSGWAPSCSIHGVSSSIQVIINTSDHSSTTSPGLGATTDDADGFESLSTGDQVLVIKRGDMDNATALTITAIDSTSVTFNAAHGLTDTTGAEVIGYLVPMRSALGTVPTDHLKYAQIGAVTVS